MSDPPPFDPSKPFTRGSAGAPAFDESKPFTRSSRLPPPEPAPETSTVDALWNGLVKGAGNVALGGARIAAEGGITGDPKALEREAQARQGQFERQPTTRQHPNATAIGETLGEMGVTAPLGATRGAAALWERLVSGGLGGATGGGLGAATTAPGGPEFFPEVGSGAQFGGVTGAGLGGAGYWARPPSVERPMYPPGLRGPMPSPQLPPPRQPPPQRPMLALPPPQMTVAGQPATQTGGSPLVSTALSAGGPLRENLARLPALRAELERRQQPGMLPPGPQSTMTSPAATPVQSAGRPTPQPPELPPTGGRTLPGPQPREARSWLEAARMMQGAGVRLSPGMARNVGYKERSLQEWPILRNFVRGSVGRTVDDFDRAVAQQALDPLGAVVPRNLSGHDLMRFGGQAFDQAYDQVLPHVALQRSGVARMIESDPELMQMRGEIGEDHARRLTNILQNRVLGRFDNTGMMNGRAFKSMERELSGLSDSLRGTNDNALGVAIQQTLGKLRGELGAQNPEYAPQLQQINRAFSMWADLRAAAGRSAIGKSRFEPRDLLQSLKGSMSEKSFAEGRNPMQAFAEAGDEVISPSLAARVPETSRSAARMMGDIMGGAFMTPPYLAARGLQSIPGAGRAISGAAGSAGFEAGKSRDDDYRFNPAPGLQ